MNRLKSLMVSATIGGAIGAIVLMAGLTLLNKFAPIQTIDLLSFSLVILGVIVTAFTIIGSFTLVNTWNDIDARSKTIVEKYQRDAKQEIDKYQNNAKQEIERNSQERQKALKDVADSSTTLINKTGKDVQRYGKRSQWILGVISIAAIISLTYNNYRVNKALKHMKEKP